MKNLYSANTPSGISFVNFCLVLCFIGISISSYGQSQTENYIKTTTYKKEFQTSQANPAIEDAVQQITYYDGLGRPIQQILHKQSGSGNDVITHMEYDGFGRKEKEFLPYVDGAADLDFRTTAASDQYSFYVNGSPGDTGNPHFDTTNNAYSQSFYEPSPLNRVLKQAAPGDAWVGNENDDNDHTIKFEYTTNSANEVKKYRASATWSPTLGLFDTYLIEDGYYDENELYVTVVKDENWTVGNDHTTREYKNKSGQIVLKRTYGSSKSRVGKLLIVAHDTYYVYDDFGNLTYVIPPLVYTSQTITSQILEDICYQYKYDHRNRLVEKKLPGKQWEYMVYDKFDRPVATGPAHSPFLNITSEGWLITKYDQFDRPVITGWMQETGPKSSSARKSLQDTYTNQATHSESKASQTTTVNNVTFQYTNNSFPTSGYHILTIDYFDDYEYPNAPSTIPATVEGQSVYYNASQKPKGLPTGSWVRVSNSSSTTSHELTYSFYDTYSNPIRSYTKNHLTGYTELDSKFDFSGKVLYSKTRHKLLTTDTELAITDTYEYTPQDRILNHRQQVDQEDEQQLFENTYDEIGQLIDKKVGSDIMSPGQYNHLQKVDYRYNIRGWLTHINDVVNLQQPYDPNDLFAFKINYETATEQDYSGSVDQLYNGNISETVWLSESDNILRSYGYAYDPMNRLTEAIYGKPNATVNITHNYNEWLSYDANGNIMTLDRNGISDIPSNIILIDDLAYEYDNDYSNLLINVTDATNNDAGFKKGYPSGNPSGGNDFEYDDNGNLIVDWNKGITDVVYNHLNLPIKVTFDNASNKYIQYLYTATGQKVQKTVRHIDSLSHTRYSHGFQYFDDVLQFYHTPEGYVKNTPTITGEYSFDYVYNYIDHLGNVRVSYAQEPQTGELEILEENHYYPFGLKHTNYSERSADFTREEELNEKSISEDTRPTIPMANPGYAYKFNGMELQSEFGVNVYDFGARNYDPALGRWMNIDPLAEKMRRHSPYNYAFNNPIYFIDPDGMEGQSNSGSSSGGSDTASSSGGGVEGNVGAAILGVTPFTEDMAQGAVNFKSNNLASSSGSSAGSSARSARSKKNSGEEDTKSNQTSAQAFFEDPTTAMVKAVENGYDENGNKVNDKGGDEMDYLYDEEGNEIGCKEVEYKTITSFDYVNSNLQSSENTMFDFEGFGVRGWAMANGSIDEDNTLFELYAGGKTMSALFNTAKIPFFKALGKGIRKYAPSLSKGPGLRIGLSKSHGREVFRVTYGNRTKHFFDIDLGKIPKTKL